MATKRTIKTVNNNETSSRTSVRNWVHQLMAPPYPNMFVVMYENDVLVSKPVVSIALYDKITTYLTDMDQPFKSDKKERKIGYAVACANIIALADEDSIVKVLTPMGEYSVQRYTGGIVEISTEKAKKR